MEWNWNIMEWKWNQNGICNCYCYLRNIIHNSSSIRNKKYVLKSYPIKMVTSFRNEMFLIFTMTLGKTLVRCNRSFFGIKKILQKGMQKRTICIKCLKFCFKITIHRSVLVSLNRFC